MASEMEARAATLTSRRRFDGAIAIVTGSASGIGRATALALAAEGATVACLDLELPHEVRDGCAEMAGDALALAADVSSPQDWERVAQDVAGQFGRVDVLANVAGIMSTTDGVLEQDLETWNRVLTVNLTGTWLGMRAVMPAMVEAGRGAVVNVASGVALVGFSGLAAYTASKGAIIALTRQAAVEVAPRGVRVNAVAPGWTDTPLSRAGNSPEMADLFARSIPAQRVGEPGDIAKAIAFLASDDAAYVVGQTYAVDGGLSAGRP